MIKEKIIKLSSSVSISIGTNKILLRKGVWNHIFSEISKDFFDNNEWKEIVSFFIGLSEKNKYINLNDKKWNKKLLIPMINQLWENDWIILNDKGDIKIEKFNIIVSKDNEKIIKKIYKTNKIISWENTLNNFSKFPKNLKNNILCFFESQDISNVFLLNKFLYNRNSENVIFAIFDAQYLHIIIIGDFTKGCIECFSERILLKMTSEESDNFKNFIENINDYIFSNNKNLNNIINLVSYLLKNSAIFNKDNKYFWNKSISMYLPTMEINYDKIFKIPNCSTCCNSSDGSKFYFSNYDLLKEIKNVK